MKSSVINFFKNFLLCGVTGWCMEILFTGLNQLRRRDMTLTGRSSILMFPIYGMAALLRPVYRLIRRKPFWVRGSLYTLLIFIAEFLSGKFLQKHASCPWDYGKSRFHIGRVVRLDYAPFWFCAGLLFEIILNRKDRN
ncbi:MAG: hypothetical protein IKL04_08820 [Lachnospiraceae bacterium]|nr:hypothetical protein [Lachnospiraceae bacterium]